MAAFLELSASATDAGAFFGKLKEFRADLVLDVRLRNTSQLAGFTRRKDLEYLVPVLTGARYCWDTGFAASPELLGHYLRQEISWESYRQGYDELMKSRRAGVAFRQKYSGYRRVAVIGPARPGRPSHSGELIRLLKGKEK